MIKRQIAWVLVVLLLVSASAWAESVERVEIGAVFSITRPEAMEEVELTEDDAAEGMIYAAMSDELELYVWLIDGSKEELYALYEEDDFMDEVNIVESGDLEYLEYRSEQELGVVFTVDENQYYEIVFYCVTDDAMAQARETIASIQLL